MREHKLNLELWPLYRAMEAHLGKLDPQKVHYFIDRFWRRLLEFLEAHRCIYERVDWGLPQTAPLPDSLPQAKDGIDDYEEGLAIDANVALHYAVRFRWQDEELFALYSEPELGVVGGRALIHHYSDISVFYLVRNERDAWSHSFDCLMEEAAELLARGGRCLIVLEDIETSMSDPAEKSALLNAIDGVFSHLAPGGALLIVATTNHPEQLDRALLQRPSRFDRVFVFQSPNAELRRQYLQGKSKLEPTETELAELVEQTEGMSFAFLQELIVSAHYEAAFAGESLGLRHYREAARRLIRQLRQGEQLQTWPIGFGSRRPAGFFVAGDSDEES